MAKLLLNLQGQTLAEFPIEKDRITLGRRPDNDIHIDNLAVSGHHAEVVRLFGQCFVEDLDSTNGTFVNGQRVSKQMLKDGDVVLIGKHELRFCAEDSVENTDESQFDRTVLIRAPAPKVPPAAEVTNSHTTRITPTVSPASSSGVAKVVILSGPDKGKEFNFTKEVTTFGKRGVQVVTISHQSDGYYLKYIEGNSAPLVNGVNLAVNVAVLLKEYDLLEVAGIKMTFMPG